MRFLILLILAGLPALANVCTTTAGSDAIWTTAANWINCGGTYAGANAGDTAITTKAMTIPDGANITLGNSGPAMPCVANAGACTRPPLSNVAGSTLLAAATYYVKYALVDAATGAISSPSPESQGLVLTTPGSQLPRFTFPSLLGVPVGTTANLYVGTSANGETLYATGIAAGTTTYDLSVALGTGAVPAYGVTGLILGGSLTVGQGASGSLTMKGEIATGNNTITFANKSSFTVDHSGQNESTKRPYVMWNQSASTQSSAKVVTTGTGATSADWVFWKMNVGGASSRWQSQPSTYVGGDRFLDGGLVQLAYLDMRAADGTGTCGDVNWPCISMAQSSATRTVSLDHVICTGCGEILHNYGYYSAGATISWKNITTTGSLGTYSIFAANYQLMTVDPIISGNSFDKLTYLPVIEAAISDNYFAHGMMYYTSGAINESFKCTLTGNFIRQLTGTDADWTACGDLTNNYIFMDDYTDAGALQNGTGKGNPHGPRNGTYTTWNITGNLFTANGQNKLLAGNSSQGSALFPKVSDLTSVISYNIVTQNPDGADCNLTLATPDYHSFVLVQTYHHNTACSGSGGTVLRMGEDDIAGGSNTTTFRDNLMYNPTTLGGVPSTDTYSIIYAIRKDQPIGAYPGTVAAGGHLDILTSASNYNFSCGVRDPVSQQNYKGYYYARTSMFPPSAQALPANDIQFGYNTGPVSGGCSAGNGPQFVGATANGVDGMPSIITWAVAHGATGTNAQKVTWALTALMGRSLRTAPTGVTIADLVTTIKNGHQPQNSQVHNTSSIGDDIGAMPFYNPVTATTAYLRYGTAGDVATVTAAVNDLSTIKLTTTGRTIANGTLISVFGVEGCYEANGTRLKAKWESGDTGNSFHLRTFADANVTPCASAYTISNPGWVGPIQAYNLKDHPRVFLDGSTGSLLTNLVAKATGSYAPWAAMKTALTTYFISNCPGATCFYSDKQYSTGASGTVNGTTVDTSIGTAALTTALLWKSWQLGSTDLNSTQGGLALDATKWYLNNLELSYMQGTLACFEPTCGTSPGRDILDTGGYYSAYLGGAYSLIRDQLTTGEKTDFNDKIWNDIDRAGTTCTNPDTVGVGTAATTNGNPVVVGTGTSWLSTMAVDSTIQFDNGRYTFLVKTVTDDTHITLYTTPDSNGVFSGAYRYARRWQTGDCGWSWVNKHKADALPKALLHGLSYGGSAPLTDAGNNRTITLMFGRIALALATADDDPRAVPALEEAWAWTFDSHFKLANEFYTPFNQSGVGYSWNRTAGFLVNIASNMNNSVASPTLDLRAQWMKRLGTNLIHTLDSKTGDSIVWGLLNQQYWSGFRSRLIPLTYSMFPAATEAQNATYALRNTLYNTNSAGLVWTASGLGSGYAASGTFNFLYGGPSDTLLDYRSNPKQYLFRSTETTAGPTSHGFNMVTSRTGWTSTTDTNVLFQAWAQTEADHQNVSGTTYRGNHGSYKILKNGYLIAEDSTQMSEDMLRSGFIEITQAPIITSIAVASNVGTVTTATPHGFGGGSAVKISGCTVDTDLCKAYTVATIPTAYTYTITTANVTQPATYNEATLSAYPATSWRYSTLKGYTPGGYSNYQDNRIIRWAGADPTGDSASRYTYALGEFAGAFNTGVATRVQRHFVHFKGGSQDYVVAYDDIVAASANRISTYIHYINKTGTVIQSDWSVVSTGASNKIATQILNPGTAGTMRVFTGDSDDPAPGSVGTYGSGNGVSYRVGLCASADGGLTCSPTATSAEWFAVHAPYGSTSGTFPAVTLLTTIDSNFRGTQIADSSKPAVFVVARSGATQASVTFTSTHSGTGQYLVAGIAPGTYNVTVGGSAVLSGATVNADDNTLYFESTSGAVVISAGSASPSSQISGKVSFSGGGRVGQ